MAVVNLMLVVTNLAGQYRMMQKNLKNDWTLAHGYSSESTQQELSNEYQHDRVYMVFKNLCVLVLWTKKASALEGLILTALRSLQNKAYQKKLFVSCNSLKKIG